MYRKNTATQYIYFGLINATSGAALTGATVTAYRALDGNAQASATGTTTELGNGQYRFNLSQADTNANNGSYLFTATNAIPVEKTVVFTAADPTDATAFGISRLDAAITSRMATFTLPTNFSSLAITAGGSVTAGTVSDKTGYSLSQAFPTNFASMAITAGGAVTAGTVSDKTGYSLASGGLASVTAWTVAITGNITGNLSGSVGSVTTGVTVSTNNDKTGYSLSQAFPSNFSSLAISAGTGAVTVNGDTFGNTFVITNLATQTSVNTLIGYVDTEVAAIKTVTDKVDTMLVQEGVVYQYTVNALENGPGGSQSTPPINVYPVSASTPERVNGTTLTFYLYESRSVSIATDFTLTSMTLEFVVEDSRGNDVYTVANASITKSSQTATIPITSTVTGSLGQYNWSLRDITTGNSVIARGVLSVQNAASIG